MVLENRYYWRQQLIFIKLLSRTGLGVAPLLGSEPPFFFRTRRSVSPLLINVRCGNDVTVPNGTDLRNGVSAAYSNENETPDTNTIVLCSLPKLRCRSWAPLRTAFRWPARRTALDRKLAAAEAVETKRMHVGAYRLTSKMPK